MPRFGAEPRYALEPGFRRFLGDLGSSDRAGDGIALCVAALHIPLGLRFGGCRWCCRRCSRRAFLPRPVFPAEIVSRAHARGRLGGNGILWYVGEGSRLCLFRQGVHLRWSLWLRFLDLPLLLRYFLLRLRRRGDRLLELLLALELGSDRDREHDDRGRSD